MKKFRTKKQNNKQNEQRRQFLVVLQANKRILIRNIIPCEDLLNKLAQQKVFPSSMIKEIQVSHFFEKAPTKEMPSHY